MTDLVNLSLGNAFLIAIAGYLVDFLGIVLLMLVIMAMGSFFTAKAKAGVKTEVETAEPAVPEKKAEPAPGSAGELKLYDTDPRDAAMVMAIVADHLGKPLNELRFKSIREVK